MKIGLIDVDSHYFPNLALMRISAYHKGKGDDVEWWQGNLFHYDKVYKSKVFSFTLDIDVWNADEIIQGGTGYAITVENGLEVYHQDRNPELPPEIEQMFPDYSIYPQFDFAVAMTTRGCPRNCPFCVVSKKEGRKTCKVADVSDFYAGQKRIEVLDANITACADRFQLYEDYARTGAKICFNQGLDMRLLNDKDLEYLNRMRIDKIHFAWDNPKDDLADKFEWWVKSYKPHLKPNHGNKGMVYIITNFNSTMEQNLERVYKLRSLGLDPYIMIYQKETAPKEIKHLQRWVNNKIIFYKVDNFTDYLATRKV